MSVKPNKHKFTTKLLLNNTVDSNVFEICNGFSSIYKLSDIRIEDVNNEEDSILLYARSTRTDAVCPYCGNKSHQVHSRYIRKIHDLSILGKEVLLLLESRKFFCKNIECNKKTFAEQPGNEVFRYRRRTRRLELSIIRNGLLLSSLNASKLLSYNGIKLSSSTILRNLHRITPSNYTDVEKIGVDDWAWRKGVSYGTIIIDLLRRHPIDILGDREEDSFRRWIKCHENVGLVSRDRSTEYSSAITSIRRNIIEIADKFHLIKNVQDRIGKLISTHYAEYRNKVREKESKETFPVNHVTETIPTTKVYKKETIVDQRMIMFREVKELQQKGFKSFAISNKLGIARQTATKYCGMEELPERNSKFRNNYSLYDQHVEEGVAKGIALRTLYTEICGMGFKGSLTPFYDHYRYLSDGHRGFRPKSFKASKKVVDDRSGLISIKQISAIIDKSIRKKSISKFENGIINILSEFDWFRQMYDASKKFYNIITGNNTNELIKWMKEYWHTKVQTLKTFIIGIKRDYQAVKNTIRYNITNGITEGFVNKLKVVKRSMYGKAGLKLLKIKMVVQHSIFN